MKFSINISSIRPKIALSLGITRYVSNILDCMSAMGVDYSLVYPQRAYGVVKRHLWEQFILPKRLNGELLWSPAGSGSMNYLHQVVTVHDLIVADRPDLLVTDTKGYALIKSCWLKFLWRRLLPRLKGIVAVSTFTKSRIIELYKIPDERVHVIYEASRKTFKPTSRGAIDTVKKIYNIVWERYVLVLDSLEPKGNFPRLIQAWQRLSPSSKEDTGLVIVGSRDSRVSLITLGIGDCPKDIMFTGFVEDTNLPAIYSGASVFVFPSLYEGFGLPPLEAMACGAPVVVSNATSLPEVCGDAAVYVDPLNVESIAEGIQRVLEDETLANELRKKGLAQAAKFSWEKSAKEHVELFKRLM